MAVPLERGRRLASQNRVAPQVAREFFGAYSQNLEDTGYAQIHTLRELSSFYSDKSNVKCFRRAISIPPRAILCSYLFVQGESHEVCDGMCGRFSLHSRDGRVSCSPRAFAGF
jgi:hypothetical protein